jgi:hypothetical protein
VAGQIGSIDEWRVEVIRDGEGVIAEAGGSVAPSQETVQVPEIRVTLNAECESLRIRIQLLAAGAVWWLAERQLQVCTQGANGVDVPETQFAWAGPPQPEVDTEVLRFTVRQGEQSSQSFRINYGASGTLNWNVRVEGASQGWLTVQPATGSSSAAEPGVVTVTADGTGLEPGSYSATVVVDGFSGPAQEVRIELTVLERPRYTLNVSKFGQGTVTSNPAGISIGTGGNSDSGIFTEGTQVTLTATPSAGWRIVDWGGVCNGVPASSNQCVFGMDADRSASVTMAENTYTLSVSKTGQGTVTSNPAGISIGAGGAADSGVFAEGTQVTLTASPAVGWMITDWGGACNGVSADSNQCVVGMDADKSASVTMAKDSYTLNVSKTGQGTVTSNPAGISIGTSGASDSGTFTAGTAVTLTAIPSEGWQITDWGGACNSVSADSNQCVVNMDADKSASVTMEQNLLTLSVSKTGQGTVASNPAGISIGTSGTADSGVFTFGTQVTLTATPSVGWRITDWGGACNSVPASSNQCVISMDASKSASVTMEQTLYTLDVGKTGQGTVTSNPAGISIGTSGTSDSGTFPEGTQVTLTVDPSAGWQITDWGGACNAVPSSSNQCVVAMDGNKNVSVTLGKTAILWVSTDSLLFIAQGASAPGPESFQIRNDGVGTLTWNYLIWDNTTGCVNSVILLPGFGSLGPGQSQTVIVEVDTGVCPEGWSQSGRGFTITGSDGSLTTFELGILRVPSPGPGIYGERYRRVCQNCCLSDPDGDWYKESVEYYDFQGDVNPATSWLFGTWRFSDGTQGTYTYGPASDFITYVGDGVSGTVTTDPCYNFLDGARTWVDITLQLRDGQGNLGNLVSFRITPG